MKGVSTDETLRGAGSKL